jgi:putative glutamine amidotransferase
MARAPLVGITCDRRMRGLHPFQMAGEKYVLAVRDGAHAVPLLIPALVPPVDIDAILDGVHGLLFTGSPSNVAPRHYGGPPPRDPSLLDEARDAITLPLLKAAIAAGLPVFCICRGFQELNVALGGTLHQHLHEVNGYSDHRERDEAPLDEQYGPAHAVNVAPGGILEPLLAPQRDFMVNSLHEQGVESLAPGLRIEAQAPDGAIEAVSMAAAKGFLIGVQWHPEWKFAENPVSRALFAAFGDAVRAEAQRRTGGERP